jgi:tRNA pseudouridine38-40 synthase
VSWEPVRDEWHFEICANAFLYRMVRRLVFVQVAVAQGKIQVEAVDHSLAEQAKGRDRSGLPSGLAPPQGLTLAEVIYSEE